MRFEKSELKRAFVDTIPVLSGYIVLGIGFGLILKSNGYGIGWAMGMSAFIYAGSMQFLTIELMASKASLLSVALTTLMVNARHIFYGISIIDKYNDTGKARPYLIYSLTDETYSLVCEDKEEMTRQERIRYYVMVSVMNHLYWVAGSALGSLIGSIITFNTEGVDFALTALFITVATNQWLSSKEHFPAITGFASTALCLLIFGKENFLIPSMLAITAVMLLRKRKITGGLADNGANA